jgi:LacI family transcriptional regulator
MVRSWPTRPRIALAANVRSGFEEDVFRGVLDYARRLERWEFVGSHLQPFIPIDQLDLTAIDGMIGAIHSQTIADQVMASGIAAVNTSNTIAEMAIPRVAVDNEAVGRLGGEYLLQRGFGHFGFVTHGESWFSQSRYEGFRQIIEQQAGLTCRVLSSPDGKPFEDTSRMTSWFVAQPKPIAIMAANDIVGRLVVDAATAAGLRIPDDLAVLGVDNDEWYTALLTTPLSSVELPTRQIGYRAAQVLDQLLAGEPAPPDQLIPPVGVVTRRSTDITLTEDAIVAEAMRYIGDHCGEPITIDHVLNHVGISRRNLEMRMKRAVGATPHVTLNRQRIKRARSMLIESRATIGEIARACGFDNQGNFTVMFKRETGLTPSQFRRQAASS